MAFDHDDFMDCIARHKTDNQSFAIATVVRTKDSTAGTPGDKLVICADGTMTGWVGGGCTVGAVKKAAMAAMADGRSRLIRVRPKDDAFEGEGSDGIEIHNSSCPSKGTTEVFVEPVLPKPRLLIVGTSPVAKNLCGLAKAMGYAVVVAGNPDDLAAFGEADTRIEGFDIPEHEPACRYVVVSSQGVRDRDCLSAALSMKCDYIAFVGSRRKTDKVKSDLIEAGCDRDRIAAIHAPAGIAIGAVTPDEIALSILAEIVRERRLGTGEVTGSKDSKKPGSSKSNQASAKTKSSGSCCGDSVN